VATNIKQVTETERAMVAAAIRLHGAAKVARILGAGREPVLAFSIGATRHATDVLIMSNLDRLSALDEAA
jgi:hypothetical protein